MATVDQSSSGAIKHGCLGSPRTKMHKMGILRLLCGDPRKIIELNGGFFGYCPMFVTRRQPCSPLAVDHWD